MRFPRLGYIAVVGGVLSALLSGCATIDPNGHADAIATPAGLSRETIPTKQGFALTSYGRITRATEPIDVYIEGDGFAWVSRTEPSLDPSPHDATGLALAAADPAPNVVYLARPCQFTPMDQSPRCAIPYWTSRRFAPDVIAAMDEAIDHVVARVPGQQINLVGYSGGGAVAVLIAARRHDVASLRTVAGNLDTEYVNRIHDVSAMPQSLNPVDVARQIAGIPQIHFSGEDDSVVPIAVPQRFVDLAHTRCAR